MFRLILILSTSLLISSANISSIDLFEFEKKFYLANSYNVFSGIVVDYYQDGSIKSEGSIDKGNKVGNWYEYYNTGKIKSKENHDLEKIFITTFYKNQSIKSSGLLYNSQPSGLWINFDEIGNEILHSYYIDGILDSVVAVESTYIPNSIELIQTDKTTQMKRDNKKISKLNLSNSSILEKINIIKDGEYIKYFDSGVYLVENYSNNVLDGEYTLFFNNGRKYIDRFITNASIDSLTLEYNSLGLLVSQYHEFIDNNDRIFKNGDYTSFHFNGNIKEKGLFISGYRYGLWEEFNDVGEKIREVLYEVDPLDLNQNFIKAKIISYDMLANKTFEYEADIFLDCQIYNQDCNSLFGKQHNIEVKNGLFQSFFKNGDIKSNGVYANNKKIGKWYEYYNTGSLYSFTDYKDSIGNYISYFDYSIEDLVNLNSSNMIVLSTGFILDGGRNGHWKKYNINGDLIKEYYMSNNKIDFNYPINTYYQSDELDNDISNEINILKEIYYCTGNPNDCSLDGLYKKYYINGNIKEIGIYINNLQYGKWNYYYSDAQIQKELIFDEYGHGNYKSYYNTGELSTVGDYKNYMKEGKWVYYYLNGDIEWIVFYLNDTINPNQLCSNWHESGYKKYEGYLLNFDDNILWDGKHIEYYDNGIIFKEGYFSNGLMNGKWIEYYNNRIRKNEGYYIFGIQSGEWHYYSKDGSLINKKNYNE